MDSTQIIKRRLAQLKRMSIQLKQSTQNTHQVDYNIVYSILQATKSSASKLSQLKQIQSRTSRSSSPLTKLLSMNTTQPYKTLFPQTVTQHKHNHKQYLNNTTRINSNKKGQPQDRYHQPNVYQDTFYPTPHQPYDQSPQQFIGAIRHQSLQHNNNPTTNNSQQQVITLKQQKAHLQQNLSNLRHQLHQLKDKLDSLNKQQQWKNGLPYFKLNHKISAFYTRMKIHENDYHKIDYAPFDAQLTLNKLIIKKPNTNQKQLDLSQLRQVHYVDSIVMFLHFGIVQTQKPRNSGNKDDHKQQKNSSQDFFENLFIQFANQQELHQWDLALYINFKIIDSLKKDKLFQTHLRRSRSKSPKRSSESKHYESHKKSKRSSDNIIEDEQDLMKKLIQRRQLYQQTKKLVSQRMIEKANQKKWLQSSGGKKPKKDQAWYDQTEEFSQTHPFQIALDDEHISSNSKFNYIVKYQNGNQQTQGEKSQRANTSKFKNLLASGKINSNNGQGVIPGNSLNGISPSQNQHGLSFNTGQHDLSLSRKLQQQRIKQTNQLKRQQQLKTKKTQKIIKKFTQQGYDLTKYSKDGFNPHDKRFFLSIDMKQLCWEQEGAKNKKSIKLQFIKEVMLQKIGQGIRKHIKKPKRQEHCIISYIKEGKMKVIELGANSTVMAQFVDQLITVIDHLKQGNH